jgi:hypothetical protein
MSFRRRALVAGASALLVAAAAAGLARADGDPASDYLLGQDVFFPFEVKVPAAEAARLSKLVADAKARGFPIKVALISGPADLGSVTALWQKPQQYAQFLGQELFFINKGPLLIVMPNGYGVSQAGKPLPAARKVLDGLPPPGADLAATATTAVRKLAAVRGIELPAPSGSSGSSRNRDRLMIAAAAAAAAVVVAVVALLRRRRGRSAYP